MKASKANIKKYDEQLGMSVHIATNRLKKQIMFDLGDANGVITKSTSTCCICENPLSVEDMSIEHMKPWRNQPNAIELFWDLKNIGFAHLVCNVGNTSQTVGNHNRARYMKGCRCELCVAANQNYQNGWKAKQYPKAHRHGTLTNYQYGCRCTLCVDNNKTYHQKRKKTIKEPEVWTVEDLYEEG